MNKRRYPSELTDADLDELIARNPPRIHGVVGEWRPGRRVRRVLDMDDSSPNFGCTYLQWYDPEDSPAVIQ